MDFASLLHGSAPASPSILAGGLLIAGALAGLSAGTLGIGGGIVLVPALYVVMQDFGALPTDCLPLAVTTALVSSLPAALALRHHHSSTGTSPWPEKAEFLPLLCSTAGALLGGAALLLLPGLYGAILFMVAALAVTGLLLFARPGKAPRAALSAGTTAGCGALGGFAGAVTGISASPVFTPLLKATGLRETQTIRTAALWDMAIAIAGALILIAMGWHAPLLPPHSLGYLNLAAAGVIAPAMFLATVFSAPHGEKARAGALRKILALFIIVTTTKMLFSVLAMT